MILRLFSNAQRGVLVAASFAVAFMLSYFGIRNALAVHYAGLQTGEAYESATHLEPADPRNWYLLGRFWQYNFEDPDAARAIRSYLSALSLNPASSETWLDLATAYESEANPVAARDAFLHAKKVYPLSAEVAWRYGNFLLRQGELEPAFPCKILSPLSMPCWRNDASRKPAGPGTRRFILRAWLICKVRQARFYGTVDSNQALRAAGFPGLFPKDSGKFRSVSIPRRNTPAIVPCG